MSGLEDGEIESEHEPEVILINESGDFNDEHLIDKLVENGNETVRNTASPMLCVTTEVDKKKSSTRHNEQQKRNTSSGKRRRSDTRKKQRDASSFSRRSGPSTSTWNGEYTRQGGRYFIVCGRQPPRPPPLESVIFPPPSCNPVRNVDSDISRLQTFMSHTGNYYPPVGNTPFFFNTVPPPPPLMPPIQQQPNFFNHVSPGGSFRGGNYDQVPMEEDSDDADPHQSTMRRNRSYATIVSHPPMPPSGELLAAQRAANGPAPGKNSSNSSLEEEEVDEGMLRQQLLEQMSNKKKRKPPRSSHSSPEKQPLRSKKSRTNSTSTVKADTSISATTTQSVTPASAPEQEIVAPLNSSVPAVQIVAPATVPIAVPLSTPSICNPAAPIPNSAALVAPLNTEISVEELRERYKVLDVTYKEKLVNIPKLKKESDELLKRLELVQSLMSSEREELKKVANEKREVQRMLDAKEMEEIEIICDETHFINFRAPAVKGEQAKKEPVVVEPEVKIERMNSNDRMLAPTPAQNVVKHVDKEEEQDEDQEDEEENADDEEEGDISSSQLDLISGAASDGNESDDEQVLEDEDLRVVNNGQLHMQPVSDESDGEGRSTGLSQELSLREKLLAKCLPRQSQSPPNVQVSSSSERAEVCRNLLLSMCKFGLNGTCGRGRDCTFLHLHQINDTERQIQLLESLLRDVLNYNDVDIDYAVKEMMEFMHRFRDYEHLIQHFLMVVMKETPHFRIKLFELFMNGR